MRLEFGSPHTTSPESFPPFLCSQPSFSDSDSTLKGRIWTPSVGDHCVNFKMMNKMNQERKLSIFKKKSLGLGSICICFLRLPSETTALPMVPSNMCWCSALCKHFLGCVRAVRAAEMFHRHVLLNKAADTRLEMGQMLPGIDVETSPMAQWQGDPCQILSMVPHTSATRQWPATLTGAAAAWSPAFVPQSLPPPAQTSGQRNHGVHCQRSNEDRQCNCDKRQNKQESMETNTKIYKYKHIN